jgi:trimeric autotransporter adhesin
MFYAGRRPMGRLFYWAVMAVMTASGLGLPASGAVPASGAATTTVSDTVYLADGTTAQGSLLISWPAFVTADGTAVAAGTTSVTLGAKGALSVALVPNAGATPAGVYYSVVFQLGPGQVRTEYWVVPTTSPTNLATVRTTPGSGVAGQPVSMQYVNSGLASKADNNAVVHLNGAEVISGTKTFSNSPNVPAPTNSADIATKGYVDTTVTTVGAGSYLPTAGGTMSGPITLPSNALATVDAVAAREIVEPEKFRQGISLVIDGVVQCLNASAWAKKGAAAPVVGTP